MKILKKGSPLPLKRFPPWLRLRLNDTAGLRETASVLEGLKLNTVCQSALCPNMYECFSKKKCTFLILGKHCTRSCKFCAVGYGYRRVPAKDCGALRKSDSFEIARIKEAVSRLGVKDVVITSVTRDDLEDGGAGEFALSIRELRTSSPGLKIEVLVPDFLGRKSSIKKVVEALPDIFSHNIETAPRLYGVIRPQASYKRSLEVIRYAKKINPGLLVKSGFMVGLGETREEIYGIMKDLKNSDCDILTIGQYLKPGKNCIDVERFLHPDEFKGFELAARKLGFKKVAAGPFVRSSIA